MTIATYNGWTNYETWCVNLWMDNEEGEYDYWHEIAAECLADSTADGIFTKQDRARFALADRLKHYHEENTPETTGVWADLLNAALSEVNWDEIARHLIDESDDDSDDE